MDAAILQKALARVEMLGGISDRADGLQRGFLSPANRAAAACVMDWMEELGMDICHDRGGTVRGVISGSDPEARPILVGSHLDTVIDAGKYDGALGIIAALAAIEVLQSAGEIPARPVHVLGFADEEGARFQSTYLGSRGVLGPLPPWLLASRDENGMTLDEVLASEGWDDGAAPILYGPESSSGYIELHIEQGRVLEDRGVPAAVVRGICGQARLRISIRGQADHAGTTPMNLRRDAMAGAAACILAAEDAAISHPPLVATVGMIRVNPGASNAIPGEAVFTLDVRHPDNSALLEGLAMIRRKFEAINATRDLEMTWELAQIDAAVSCDPELTECLTDCLEKVASYRGDVASGAGHDAVALAAGMPVGMIFIRCRAGLSHHPDEYAEPEDIAVGIGVLAEFLKLWSKP